jgi:hypothetical protein
MFRYESDGSEQPDWLAEQGKGAAQRFRETDLSLNKLWAYYYGIGGNIDEMSLDAYLHDALVIPAAQMELIAAAMAEMTDGDTP